MSGALRGRALLAFAVTGAVLIAVVAGFLATGTPGEARKRRFDERRVEDLQAIERAIDRYHREFSRLPESLAGMKTELSLAIELADPETGEAYGYRAREGREYELCATYAYATEKGDRSGYMVDWSHPAGTHCHRLRARRTD